MKTKIYISIPITGHDYEFQKRKAEEVRLFLTRSGIDAVTPFDIVTDPSTPYGVAMGACMQQLIDSATHILMLPGWEHSKGCKLEFNAAVIYNKQRLFFEDYMNNLNSILSTIND